MNKAFFSSFISILFCIMNFSHSQEVEIKETAEFKDFFYIDSQQLFPSQLRYSNQNVQAKMDTAIDSNDAVWNQERKRWNLKYDKGNSILNLEESIPVVKGPFGYVLTDGHHHMLASLKFGAKTVPIKVIADLSALDEKSFWIEMEKRGWAYPYNILGEPSPLPKDFKQLQDDPNRYFAALIARKCKSDGDINTSIGAEFPVWIKVGKDIPFIEFRISDALWKQELHYRYSMGLNPPVEFVEEARRILLKANIPGLRVISERQHYTELEH